MELTAVQPSVSVDETGIMEATKIASVRQPAQGTVKSEVRELHLRNKRFYVNGSHFPQWWNSVAEGKWEPETFLVLESFIEPGSTYIDVGAWIGATVLFAADQAGRTIAFEPDPSILPLLKENIALNPCIASRIMLYEAALSTFDGKAALFNNRPGNSGSSLLRTFGYTQEVVQKQFAETVVMDARPFLDGLDLANVSLIKIDIEGGEYDLVPHIAPLLVRHRPTLYLSLHPFNIASDLPQAEKAEQIAARTVRLLESLSCYRHVYLPASGNIGASPSDIPGLLEMARRTGTLTGSIIVSDRTGTVPLTKNGK
jgi:FkbM family methyltransferase